MVPFALSLSTLGDLDRNDTGAWRDLFGRDNRVEKWNARPIKLPSDGVMAEVRLGVTVTGLDTLVGMGLVIAFM